ncbi:MAG: SsrA-binding protein [Zetaproteobacteria bacterium CG_4_9_14_3_um_filter_49_83]|nr:MAG: SsrA-binding protein [Zetaproteobacteria bacterium CG1_02_49_23]PIQ31765.1 MAG: SsrA-binding protein [Zetaproteobacteria bacterium CG17_big_fil_post_rev_8_21_14_2_50_50_13]PIV31402.1 MAG: SsrA-binding protein [Zetaproteobacteria bacterium CG02_land_8_20_14_3_00_50_9]PIY56636.1 MAG: SsrA-binding protein [Zetaproteobacteria bacterium CG_4_10_14_0_8_um_filter_49_80]PJA34191.1 MAG: SsrA-binding protein [Zetaproteobacteria bacterium CG_4_9_14_3_um_filter_49_83]
MAMINRRARHDYQILETYEAGIMLLGPEVKSIRAGQANLAEAHCIIRSEKVLLIGCHISPYKPAAMNNPVDPTRSRQLLLNKREVNNLIGKLKTKGLTLVPLKMYFNERGFAKLQIGLAQGKKNYDKRQDLKERDIKRDLQRQYKK